VADAQGFGFRVMGFDNLARDERERPPLDLV
jgi:hypothetical protein